MLSGNESISSVLANLSDATATKPAEDTPVGDIETTGKILDKVTEAVDSKTTITYNTTVVLISKQMHSLKSILLI